MFTVSLQGLGIFVFDVTSTQRQNGSANFNLLQNISLADICAMRGVIFGGNDAGNSAKADIQLPSGEDKFEYFISYPLFQMNCYCNIVHIILSFW